MRLNRKSLNQLVTMLGKDEAEELVALAAKVDTIEAKWRAKLNTVWNRITAITVESFEDNGMLTKRVSDEIQEELEKVYVEHSLNVMLEAIKSARRMPKLPNRLAAYPKGRMPRSLAELRKLWDMWRKRGEVPPRQAAIVKQVRKSYVRKCQDVWQRHSDEYRNGGASAKYEIVNKIREAAETQHSRARTIVDTETTRYWNQTRRQTYDASPDVTHYLFMPIRDMATTSWCYMGKHPDGQKRGRGGLVYKKGDPLLDKETPPCHWNCRSEILPLTPLNPRHLALIQDKSKDRRAHECQPLPPGWNS